MFDIHGGHPHEVVYDGNEQIQGKLLYNGASFSNCKASTKNDLLTSIPKNKVRFAAVTVQTQ